MSLGTAEIAELYKDHLCYEFPATELQELLGEDGMAVKDSSRRYFLKFTGLQIVNVDCKSGIVNDLQPISLSLLKMVSLFFLSSDQLQQVVGQSLRLVRDKDGLRLYLDATSLKEKVSNVNPKVIREDYSWAPLQVSILEKIGDGQQQMIKDSFNLEIRMPRFEIIATTIESKNLHNPKQSLYKTTMTHNLSGKQMMTIIREHRLIDWASFAKKLIKDRTFGVDTVMDNGEQSLIKLQQYLGHGLGFALYKEPDQVKYEQMLAQNLQLTMMVSEKFTMQVAYLRPVHVKLVLDREEDVNDRWKKQDPSHQHLPGYLPEQKARKGKGVKQARTITQLVVPFTRLPFLKQTFGGKIDDGSDGSLLECLYDLVELHVDTTSDILSLEIPSWRKLEEINIRQLSQRYFADKMVVSEAQRDQLKYMGIKAHGRGEVKAILGSGNSGMASARQKERASIPAQPTVSGSHYPSLDYTNNSIQEMNTTQSMLQSCKQLSLNEQVTTPAIMNSMTEHALGQETQRSAKQRRLQINDYMTCQLKICRLNKVIFAQDLVLDNGKVQQSCVYEIHKKVPLSEFFTTTAQSQ